MGTIDLMRALLAADPEADVKELKAIVMPCASKASCVSIVTVRWQELNFNVTVEHIDDLIYVRTAIRDALKWNLRRVIPVQQSDAWKSEQANPINTSSYVVRLSQADLALFGERAQQYPSDFSIVVFGEKKGAPAYFKYALNQNEAGVVVDLRFVGVATFYFPTLVFFERG